ncbi:hypothetical protein NM688_g7306 [Phlebia brevispora]|uniref:Uncharacterized protein n=1 Tax=Phlebia brevispora TaxID=194682 RepID=A0ACC1S6W6_9APHY|nr:hypothetical protein NM688_g7306 [Phlebia brevispora]
MSLAPEGAANKRAALEKLRFKKQSKQDSISSEATSSSSTPPWPVPPQAYVPPLQSRDATLTSRFFPTTPSSGGKVLVPSSSPLSSESPSRNRSTLFEHDTNDHIPGLVHDNDPWRSFTSSSVDLLSQSSGFTTSTKTFDASSTRISSSSGHPILLKYNAPGQRRRPNVIVPLSSVSSDESLSEASRTHDGSSRPRITRGDRVGPTTPESSTVEKPAKDPLLTRFILTQPGKEPWVVECAWQQCGGDAREATRLLDDPSFRPVNPNLPRPVAVAKTVPHRLETGRVKEVDEATKAERQRVKEMGKKSMIYAGHNLKQHPTTTPPVSKAIADTSKSIVLSPTSPAVSKPRTRPLKRKVVDSDSEPDWGGSDDDSSRSQGSEDVNELKALEYFNSAVAEELQELTGCTLEQASKIVELRPFKSIDDLNERLNQGRKKAGPAGISPRMFEDCASIFAGYSIVDHILARCEKQGAKLRAEIASWTDSGAKVATREGSSSSRSPSEEAEDGALSLRSQSSLKAQRPDYFISKQPQTLSPTLQLKEYQMLGLNWLNLLHKERISCILADEMGEKFRSSVIQQHVNCTYAGLGKTVQVISFFAHLKEKGSAGPHLVVVPSSTLENWLREFKRFAPDIAVRAYYADKNNRSALRQELIETQRKHDEEGWEVLVTTYNLAQGDEKDRKFFRKMEWEACVFDEGHVLKNFQSQRYQALMKYPSEWRLLLTGTPLQNNLQELVSLMNFIMPEKFAHDMDSIRAVFKTKGDSKVTLLAQQRVSRAKKMMTPFVLRRRKDQVLQDLPKKTERIEWCEMTPMQKSIYSDALRRSRKTIYDVENASPEPEPLTNAKGKPAKKKSRANARTKDKLYVENSSNVLMDLRKAASHPMLFRRRFTDDVLTSITRVLLKEPDFRKRGALFELVKEDMEVMTDSELQAFCNTYKSTRKFLQSEDCYLQAGKVKVLLKLLKTYQDDNRRVLIFSQFTQILDILQRVLEREKIKFLVLTGSTPVDARQSLVDEFTEDDSILVFLLSTKAGGMGINLTAANVVIMFDQDFNPHNDKQAQDRAYRIGQKRDVEVVKLITKGSIEEDMLELGMTKLALDEAVAGDEENEERIEREIKTSLMNVVRKKLEENKHDDGDTDKMDVDES